MSKKLKGNRELIRLIDLACQKLIKQGWDYDQARFATMKMRAKAEGALVDQPLSQPNDVLDAFFGDSLNATPECSYCLGMEDVDSDPLMVTISDAHGPTHWMHESCNALHDSGREIESERNLTRSWPDYDADTAVDGVE